MRVALAVCMLALLAGCASGPCPTLAPDLRYCLRPPATGPRITVLQEFVVETSGQRETLLVRMENDDRRLAAVAVSLLGQTLVSAEWDGTSVRQGLAAPLPLLDPALLLAFSQLGAWDWDALRMAFEPALVIFTEERADGGTLSVRDPAGRTLLEAERMGREAPFASTRMRLPERAVVLRSRTLDEALAPGSTR